MPLVHDWLVKRGPIYFWTPDPIADHLNGTARSLVWGVGPATQLEVGTSRAQAFLCSSGTLESGLL